MIVHEGEKWVLYTKDGKKKLGTHATKEEAMAQERAVEASKHRKDSVFRVDRGELRSPVKADNGWMRADGYLTRAGVFEYRRADGSSFFEFRPATEVEKSAPSFDLVPLTNDHPPSGVLTADNTSLYQKGTVSSPKMDGARMRASILVTDAQTITDMEAGKVELSCGYMADLEMSPGEFEGQRYDAIQTNIRGNHVALVNKGRAGPSVRLRVDSMDLEVVQFSEDSKTEPPKMVKIKIDGVETEVPEMAAQLIMKQEAAFKAALVAAETQKQEMKAKADAAEAQAKKLEKELAEAPAKAAAAATARAALEAVAKKADVKADGSDLDVKKAVAEKVLDLKIGEQSSEVYVDGLFAAATTILDKARVTPEPETATINDTSEGAPESLGAAYKKWLKALYNRVDAAK